MVGIKPANDEGHDIFKPSVVTQTGRASLRQLLEDVSVLPYQNKGISKTHDQNEVLPIISRAFNQSEHKVRNNIELSKLSSARKT